MTVTSFYCSELLWLLINLLETCTHEFCEFCLYLYALKKVESCKTFLGWRALATETFATRTMLPLYRITMVDF